MSGKEKENMQLIIYFLLIASSLLSFVFINIYVGIKLLKGLVAKNTESNNDKFMLYK